MKAGAKGTFIHDRALCESDDVGPGTRIWAFAHVMQGAHVGRDCNVGDHAFIETGAWVGDRVTIKNAVLIWDRVRIEDDVFVGPNVVFTNDPNPRAAFKKPAHEFVATHVERGATLGANASIVCGVTIGAHAFVGAGASSRRTSPRTPWSSAIPPGAWAGCARAAASSTRVCVAGAVAVIAASGGPA